MSSKIVVSVALSPEEEKKLITAQTTNNGILPKSTVIKQAMDEYFTRRGI